MKMWTHLRKYRRTEIVESFRLLRRYFKPPIHGYFSMRSSLVCGVLLANLALLVSSMQDSNTSKLSIPSYMHLATKSICSHRRFHHQVVHIFSLSWSSFSPAKKILFPWIASRSNCWFVIVYILIMTVYSLWTVTPYFTLSERTSHTSTTTLPRLFWR